MSTTTDLPSATQAVFPQNWTMADLQEHLGGIPANRIRLYPPPGTATEEDALFVEDHEDRHCEPVDGILVEKPTATYESFLAMILGYYLNAYLEKSPLAQLPQRR